RLGLEELPLGFFYRAQDRGGSAGVLVDADRKIDLVFARVAYELFGEAQNRVAGRCGDVFEHGNNLRTSRSANSESRAWQGMSLAPASRRGAKPGVGLAIVTFDSDD